MGLFALYTDPFGQRYKKKSWNQALGITAAKKRFKKAVLWPIRAVNPFRHWRNFKERIKRRVGLRSEFYKAYKRGAWGKYVKRKVIKAFTAKEAYASDFTSRPVDSVQKGPQNKGLFARSLKIGGLGAIVGLAALKRRRLAKVFSKRSARWRDSLRAAHAKATLAGDKSILASEALYRKLKRLITPKGKPPHKNRFLKRLNKFYQDTIRNRNNATATEADSSLGNLLEAAYYGTPRFSSVPPETSTGAKIASIGMLAASAIAGKKIIGDLNRVKKFAARGVMLRHKIGYLNRKISANKIGSVNLRIRRSKLGAQKAYTDLITTVGGLTKKGGKAVRSGALKQKAKIYTGRAGVKYLPVKYRRSLRREYTELKKIPLKHAKRWLKKGKRHFVRNAKRYIHGYTRRDGTFVRGYVRESLGNVLANLLEGDRYRIGKYASSQIIKAIPVVGGIAAAPVVAEYLTRKAENKLEKKLRKHKKLHKAYVTYVTPKKPKKELSRLAADSVRATGISGGVQLGALAGAAIDRKKISKALRIGKRLPLRRAKIGAVLGGITGHLASSYIGSKLGKTLDSLHRRKKK